jgi:NAD(P)-dependent dehydrogenase (short-subunit alcohol dehydrogenase family)
VAATKPLENRVALVAGATRGAGRGIATALGEAGAVVYCTGRTSRSGRSSMDRPETIDETADIVTARGGVGIAVKVDHSSEDEVKRLIERIRNDHKRLDILVNDVWGGDALMAWGKPFWEVPLDRGFEMFDRAVKTHIITSRYAAPLMIETERGLVVEITDGNGYYYRGNLFYDLVKTSVIRLAQAQAFELRRKNVAAVAVTPGFLRSEAMLELFGVTEQNWQDGVKTDPHFIASETPLFVGRAVAALAADPGIMAKSGRVFSSWDLSDEYGFTDADGSRPHWGRHHLEAFGEPINACDDAFYRYFEAPYFKDWPE